MRQRRLERGGERLGEGLRRGGGDGPAQGREQVVSDEGRRPPGGGGAGEHPCHPTERGPDRLRGAAQEEQLVVAVETLREVGDDDQADVLLAERNAERERGGVAGAAEDVLELLELAVVDARRGPRHLELVLRERRRAEEHRLAGGVEEPEREEGVGELGTERAGEHLPPGVERHLVGRGGLEAEDGDGRKIARVHIRAGVHDLCRSGQ